MAKPNIGDYEVDLSPGYEVRLDEPPPKAPVKKKRKKKVVEVIEVKEAAEATIDPEVLASLPFVNRIPGGSQCEFIENEKGRNPLTVPPRNLSGAEQCPRVARFRLRSMTSSGTRSGNYCQTHVLAEIDRSPKEQERLQRWLVRIQDGDGDA